MASHSTAGKQLIEVDSVLAKPLATMAKSLQYHITHDEFAHCTSHHGRLATRAAAHIIPKEEYKSATFWHKAAGEAKHNISKVKSRLKWANVSPDEAPDDWEDFAAASGVEASILPDELDPWTISDPWSIARTNNVTQKPATVVPSIDEAGGPIAAASASKPLLAQYTDELEKRLQNAVSPPAMVVDDCLHCASTRSLISVQNDTIAVLARQLDWCRECCKDSRACAFAAPSGASELDEVKAQVAILQAQVKASSAAISDLSASLATSVKESIEAELETFVNQGSLRDTIVMVDSTISEIRNELLESSPCALRRWELQTLLFIN